MNIKPASIDDAPAISALTEELGYSADLENILQRLIRIGAKPTDIVLVAISDGKTVGWIQAHLSEALESGLRAEIVGLVVAKNHRRGGLGRKLVEAIEDWALAQKATTITVRSNLQRTESHIFYPALGFEQTKVQAVYRKSLKARKGPN